MVENVLLILRLLWGELIKCDWIDYWFEVYVMWLECFELCCLFLRIWGWFVGILLIGGVIWMIWWLCVGLWLLWYELNMRGCCVSGWCYWSLYLEYGIGVIGVCLIFLRYGIVVWWSMGLNWWLFVLIWLISWYWKWRRYISCWCWNCDWCLLVIGLVWM